MIFVNAAQKDAPKVAPSAAQVQINAAQIDSDAFNLLLAFMNAGSKESAGSTADLGNELSSAIGAAEGDDKLLSDQSALAAKVADWFASNAASLAALGGMATSPTAGAPVLFQGLGNSEGLVNALGQKGLGPEQVELLISKLGIGAQASSTDVAAAQGVALVSAIQQATDSQSLAAALMAAVGAGVDKGLASDKGLRQDSGLAQDKGLLQDKGLVQDRGLASSNLLLANLPRADALLADAFSKGLFALGLGGVASVANGKLAEPELAGNKAYAHIATMKESANNPMVSLEPQSPAKADTTVLADEKKQRQLEQSDALLSSSLPGAPQGFDALRQAMSAQDLGKASVANAGALESTVSWLASQQGGSATIDLSPPELGSLRLELKIDAGGESAVLIVHAANDAAKAAIEQSLDRLYEAFQSSGMALQVSVGSGSSQFAGMFSGGFEDRAKALAVPTRALEGVRASAVSAVSKSRGVATDALSLYA